MAYTTIFTKNPVRKIDDNNFILSVNVVVNDGETDIKTTTFSVRYNSGWSIADVTAKLQRKMKKNWDNYADEKAVFENPALDTVITNVKTGYDNYINS